MFWIAIYIMTIAAGGLAAGAVLRGRRGEGFIQFVGESLAIGCGVVPTLLLWLSMAGFKPSRVLVLMLGAMPLIALIFLRRLLPRVVQYRPSPMTRGDVLTSIAALLIALAFCGATITALLPTFEIDAISIWGLKAKVLFAEPLYPRPAYFSDLSLSYSHLDYPLLVPALWAGAYATMGVADNGVGKVVLLLPLVATLAMLYGGLRRSLDRSRASALTALAMALPAVAWYGGRGLADTTLAMFVLAAALAMIDWQREGDVRDALRAAMFGAFAAMTKLEGQPLAVTMVVLFAAIAFIRRDRKTISGAVFAVIVLGAILMPWLIWSADLPRTHENYQSRLRPQAIIDGLSRLPALASAMWIEIRHWGYIAPIAMLVLSSAAGWRGWKSAQAGIVWTILLAQLMAYTAAFLVTPWDVTTLASMSVRRLLLHVAPLAMLLSGFHWSSARRSQRSVA